MVSISPCRKATTPSIITSCRIVPCDPAGSGAETVWTVCCCGACCIDKSAPQCLHLTASFFTGSAQKGHCLKASGFHFSGFLEANICCARSRSMPRTKSAIPKMRLTYTISAIAIRQTNTPIIFAPLTLWFIPLVLYLPRYACAVNFYRKLIRIRTPRLLPPRTNRYNCRVSSSIYRIVRSCRYW